MYELCMSMNLVWTLHKIELKIDENDEIDLAGGSEWEVQLDRLNIGLDVLVWKCELELLWVSAFLSFFFFLEHSERNM